MTRSESIDLLAGALVKAQSEFLPIARKKKVLVKSDRGSYEFMYAPLDDVVSAIRPILAANDLAFTQGVSGEFLITTILHKSGQSISDSMPLKGGGTAQAYGSELSYKRRYAVSAMLGLVTEDDDDARQTEEKEKKEKPVFKKVATEEYNALPVEVQVQLKTVADQITADFYTLTLAKAFERYEKEKNFMSAEEQIGMWSLLGSEVRSGLKKHGQSIREGVA